MESGLLLTGIKLASISTIQTYQTICSTRHRAAPLRSGSMLSQLDNRLLDMEMRLPVRHRRSGLEARASGVGPWGTRLSQLLRKHDGVSTGNSYPQGNSSFPITLPSQMFFGELALSREEGQVGTFVHMRPFGETSSSEVTGSSTGIASTCQSGTIGNWTAGARQITVPLRAPALPLQVLICIGVVACRRWPRGV